MQAPFKYNTPIYNYLREYASQNINVFHMPGHKHFRGNCPDGNLPGKNLSREVLEELSKDILSLDLTEVEGTDNLHYPEGIIMEAQQRAAKAFGADETFFLVNGSTCGIQAAIMSVCARGQKIIIGRDSHKAVVAGLILSGAEPVFVYPQYVSEFGIGGAISAQDIAKSLQEYPEAAAVLITRPNYYGICSDIEEISRVVHSYNKILIVDEAHGAHMIFSPKLPASALQYCADICIQSAHKTLPAVTQGAYLHVRGNRVDVEKLKFNLAMLQTSSPSYIIMSYLDIAREIMVLYGERELDRLIENIESLKHKLEKINYNVLSDIHLGNSIVHDKTRLVIDVSKLGLTGFYAEKLLRDEFKTQVEMSDYRNLVLITTIADSNEDFIRLSSTMGELAKLAKLQRNSLDIHLLEDEMRIKSGSAKMTPYEAYAAEKHVVLLQYSKGKICAEVITPYPPGIPILYPGEIIDEKKIKYIMDITASGGKVNGIGENKSIKVIK